MKKIELSGRLGKGKFTIVDDCNYPYLNQWKWTYHNSGYVSRAMGGKILGKRKTIYMHRLILDVSRRKYTDHINGNRLDNRKENLRIVTQSQNQMNRGKQNNNTTGHTGVYREKHSKINPWFAQ